MFFFSFPGREVTSFTVKRLWECAERTTRKESGIDGAQGRLILPHLPYTSALCRRRCPRCPPLQDEGFPPLNCHHRAVPTSSRQYRRWHATVAFSSVHILTNLFSDCRTSRGSCRCRRISGSSSHSRAEGRDGIHCRYVDRTRVLANHCQRPRSVHTIDNLCIHLIYF